MCDHLLYSECTSVLAATGTKMHMAKMLWLLCTLLIVAVSGFKYLETGNACKQGLAEGELHNAVCCSRQGQHATDGRLFCGSCNVRLLKRWSWPRLLCFFMLFKNLLVAAYFMLMLLLKSC